MKRMFEFLQDRYICLRLSPILLYGVCPAMIWSYGIHTFFKRGAKRQP